MTYYNPHDRYKRRAAERMGGFIVSLVVLGLVFAFGFWLGGERSEHGAGVLKQRVQSLEAQNAQIQQDLVAAKSEAQTAVMQYEQLQTSYEEKIPDEAVANLLDLVSKQIAEGRSPERLAFLIRSARPPRNCSETETRRFVVATPANEGPKSQITVADGSVVITGNGVSARNESGEPEAWFDPSKSVNLTFSGLGGVANDKKGTLPIHHSMVVGDREYRFTVSDGARSFAKVTFDSCDYP